MHAEGHPVLVATWWRWAALVLCAVVGVSLAGETWDEPAGDVTVATSGGLSPEWTGRRYERGHLWAFYPVTRPQVPQAAGHPIDAFIEDRLAAAGLEPAPPADRRALIRRATLGLTGLPPMVREIEVFLADTSPDAFERVIERLLSSPQYGQRMAQHWLDVTRYADTAGLSNDHDRPNAWRYRDYVVRAFNTDKPYDRFVLEQVAGDEIDDQEPELLIAAGFLRMGPWEHTAMSVAAETRQQYLDDVTHAVGETFLGVGLQCAKCHDHKFDPIPTRDYYQMQAVFAPVQFADRPAAFAGWENTAAFKEGRARVERLLEEARAGLREIREKEDRAIVAWLVDRGMEITVAQAKKLPEDQRPPRHLGLSNEDLGVAKVWQKRQELLQRQMMRYEPLAMSIYNGPPRIRLSGAPHPMPAKRSGEAQPVHILLGGSLQSPGETVGPGALSGAENLSGLSAQIPQTLDGRRLALAAWITDPRNPLTARVMVNRIWQWHFGRGLAANPNNFGKMGAKPTHPQLLNWLADEFIRSGWSVKHIHKLIMTSQVYQRSTRHPRMDAVREADAANAMLSFFPPRRLTAEELRDAMLTASGELNLEIGGPPVYPESRGTSWARWRRPISHPPRRRSGTGGPFTPCGSGRWRTRCWKSSTDRGRMSRANGAIRPPWPRRRSAS
jgi:hypothetical protein